MDAKDQSREQLLNEMTLLKRRVSVLEQVESEREQAWEALLKEKDKAQQYLDIAGVIIVVINADQTVGVINRRGCEVLGYGQDEVIGENWFDKFLPARIRDEVRAMFARLMSGANEAAQRFENPILTKHGEERVIAWRNSVLRDEAGNTIGTLSSGEDITEHMQTEKRLEEFARRVERLHDAAHRLVACESEDAVYQITVEAAEKILSFPICTLDIVEGNSLVVKATSSQVPAGASQGTPLDGEGLAAKTYRTRESYVFGRMDAVPDARPTESSFQSGISVPIGDIGVIQVASRELNAFTQDDVRALELLVGHTAEAVRRIRLQNELKEQAVRDPLTGVFNRRYFTQSIEKEIRRSKRYGHPIGFVMIDINRFKEINDRFGHQVGDAVLREMADLFQGQVRDTDIVVRYGGDEFLIVLPETDGETEAVSQRIRAAVAKRNEEDPLIAFPITLAVGTEHWRPDMPQSLESILSRVDRRMYTDKRRERATLQ